MITRKGCWYVWINAINSLYWFTSLLPEKFWISDIYLHLVKCFLLITILHSATLQVITCLDIHLDKHNSVIHTFKECEGFSNFSDKWTIFCISICFVAMESTLFYHTLLNLTGLVKTRGVVHTPAWPDELFFKQIISKLWTRDRSKDFQRSSLVNSNSTAHYGLICRCVGISWGLCQNTSNPVNQVRH